MTTSVHNSDHKSGASSTSRSLIRRLKRNEPDAWETLVNLYAPLIYTWCRRYPLQEETVADILQEVFQSVAASIGDFQKKRSQDTFRGWLRVITRNKVHDFFRKQARQVGEAAGGTGAQIRLSQCPDENLSLEDELASTAAQDAETAAYSRLLRRALDQIREHFEERTWQAFWRTVIDGQSPKDVAEDLSMSSGAVRVAKSRVLHRLRKQLGETPD